MNEQNETNSYVIADGKSKYQADAPLLMEQAVRLEVPDRYKRWERLLPIVLFVSTVLVRIVVAWNLPINPLTPDRHEYEHLAHNLIETGKYGFSADWHEDTILRKSPWRFLYDRGGTLRAPGYPVVLAALELTVGSELRVRQVILAVIEGFTAVLVFYWGKLLFGSVAGAIAALVCVFNLGMCYYLTWCGREPFLTFFFVGGFYLVFRAAKSPKPMVFGVLAGVCFGLASYFKETNIYVGLIGALWLLYLGYRYRRQCRRAGLVMLMCVPLVMAPWIVRNWLFYGKYVGFSNPSSYVLWHGLVDRNWKQHQSPDLDPYKAATVAEANRRCKEQIKIYVKEQPLAVIRAMTSNVRYFWSPVPTSVWKSGFKSPIHVVSLVFYLVCFFFAGWSLWIFRRWEETRLCLLLLLAMTGLHALAEGYVRYRLVFDPLWFVFIGGALQLWLESRRTAQTRQYVL